MTCVAEKQIKMRAEELWAAACIQAALPGTVADPYDDNSLPRMHDFDLLRGNIRFGACEVTVAADPEVIELWKLVNGNHKRWIEPDLCGGWFLSLSPTCRVKQLKANLRTVLMAMESQGVHEAATDHRTGPPRFDFVFRELGVVRAQQGPTDYPGSVYFTVKRPMEQCGGFVPTTGNALAEWLSTWTKTPEQAHNVTKLARAGAAERHLFVLFPGFSPAPFQVTIPLMDPDGPLPTVAPELPSGITHLWTMSLYDTGDLFAWNTADGWTRYTKDVAITSDFRGSRPRHTSLVR